MDHGPRTPLMGLQTRLWGLREGGCGTPLAPVTGRAAALGGVVGSPVGVSHFGAEFCLCTEQPSCQPDHLFRKIIERFCQTDEGPMTIMKDPSTGSLGGCPQSPEAAPRGLRAPLPGLAVVRSLLGLSAAARRALVRLSVAARRAPRVGLAALGCPGLLWRGPARAAPRG